MDKPKTLVSGTKSKSEQNCDELRTYAEPSDVKIFKVTPDWYYKFNIGEPIDVRPPTFYEEPKFNGRRKIEK